MFAVTERLLLRPGWPEEADALARAIADREIVRMLSRVPWPYARADAEWWLSLPYDPLRPRLVIVRRETGALIGGAGLHEDEPEIGYWLARGSWGHGFATEAGRALLAAADGSLCLPRVRAHHALDNPASARVLAKLGFRADGAVTTIPSAGRGGAMAVQPLVRDRPGHAALPLAA